MSSKKLMVLPWYAIRVPKHKGRFFACIHRIIMAGKKSLVEQPDGSCGSRHRSRRLALLHAVKLNLVEAKLRGG